MIQATRFSARRIVESITKDDEEGDEDEEEQELAVSGPVIRCERPYGQHHCIC